MEKTDKALVSVGVMAHNEAGLITSALLSITSQSQELLTISEIIVVISGSDDGTECLVEKVAAQDNRIRIVVECEKKGKIHSVINFLELASNDICVIASADVIADFQCFDKLYEPFLADQAVGMTGPRVLPRAQSGDSSLALRLHRELWEVHHRVALRHPKLGEIVMVKKEFVANPPYVAGCDEVMLETAVHINGGKLSYAPEAVVHNFGPTEISDYFQHRRRIHTQHLVTREALGYEAATFSPLHILAPLLQLVVTRPRKLGLILILIAIETRARSFARKDNQRGNVPVSWLPLKSARANLAISEER